MSGPSADSPLPAAGLPLPGGGWRRTLRGCGAFLVGGGLPVFLVSLATVYEVFLALLLFGPTGDGAWAAFVTEFKVRCFDYNPATGGMTWTAAWIMLAEPPFICAIVLLLWRVGGRARPRMSLLRPAAAGVTAGLLAVAGLFAYGLSTVSNPSDTLPFPGARIRTRLELPAFQLTDETGAAVDSASLRGRVTLLTGVFALCSATCPNILMEVKNLLENLPPGANEHLGVLALSLDPDRDSLELTGSIARAYGFSHPRFRYLNGDPTVMSNLTSRLQFSAMRNPETGVIDHASLFILVDADGRIAYRLSADARHRGWVRAAVQELCAEAGRTKTAGTSAR